MSKLRIWWIPQVGIKETFYVPVNTPEEGKKLLDTLAAYDAFHLQNNVGTDCCNMGGIQIFDEENGKWFDEENGKWYDWYIGTNGDYCDVLDEYCELEKLESFKKEFFQQID